MHNHHLDQLALSSLMSLGEQNSPSRRSGGSWLSFPPRLVTLVLVSCAQFLIPFPLFAAGSMGIDHGSWMDFNKNGRMDIYEDPSQPVEARVSDLLSQMTTEEKTCQLATLYGYGRVLKDPAPTPGWKKEIWKDGIANIDEMHNGVGKFSDPKHNPAVASPSATARALNVVQRWFVEETRLGIPVEFSNEGIRGANYRKTVNFPADIGLGATWDRDLVGEVGRVVNAETAALGYRNVYGVILDLARDPRWGRVVECYGEDPYLVSEYGVRMATALKTNGVIATAKHFAVYSIPKGGRDGRVRTDPHVAPREMELMHLMPWRRVVKEAGLLCAMCSYNDYDGVPVAGSHELLIDHLRTDWGFKGYIVSDSRAVEFLCRKHHVASTSDRGAAMFTREGGNVRTNFSEPKDFILAIRREIAAGRLAMADVDARVREVLRVKFLEGLFDHPYVDADAADAAIGRPENHAVALRAARESLVLLKNDKNMLPLAKNLKRVLVCGPIADDTTTSRDRYGSRAGDVVSVLAGVQALLKDSGAEVVYARGCAATDSRWPESELFPEPPTAEEATEIADAVAKAQTSDAVILCLGDADNTIGEAKSRTSLDLPGFQTDLAKALMKTGKPVVVVLMTGRPASINWINRYVPAILEAWFPGEAGGTAVAEALFGDYNPGGKLPVTFPKTVGQIPYNFPFKPGSQAHQTNTPDPNGFGNSLAEGALYDFGFGLSYTTFAYDKLVIAPAKIPTNGAVTVSCEIRNTGKRAGDEIAQLYYNQRTSSVTTYELNLCGFERVHLDPGQAKTVTFTVPASRLELINREGERVVEPGFYDVSVGSSSTNLVLNGSFSVR